MVASVTMRLPSAVHRLALGDLAVDDHRVGRCRSAADQRRSDEPAHLPDATTACYKVPPWRSRTARARADRTVADRRSARRHRVHRAVQLRASRKQQGGKFVLRIEDTDQTRARADSEQMIFDALHWVGLSWDEGPDVGGPYGPYRQSERGDDLPRRTRRCCSTSGEAYRCFCTEERLAKLRVQQQAEKQTLGYDRHCRDIDRAESARRAAAGEPYVVRLKVPLDGRDRRSRRAARRRSRATPREIDDQVLLKSDGLPTYHLANVVDDHLMEITHVDPRRGVDLVDAQARAALPGVRLGAAGVHPHAAAAQRATSRRSRKRKNPVSINYYRDAGFLPQALLNFLGTMGWSFGGDREKFTLAEMIEVFSWDRVSLGGPVFDLDEADVAERAVHPRAVATSELADALIGVAAQPRRTSSKLLPLVPRARSRSSTRSSR